MKENANKLPQPYWRKNSSLHFSIGLILSLTLVITAFEWRFRNELTETPIHNIGSKSLSEVELVLKDVPVPSPPKVPDAMPTPAVEPDIPVNPIESVTGVETHEKPLHTPSAELDKLFSSRFFKPEKTDEVVYELISAQPKGGMEAFYQYLYEHIEYPVHLRSRNITGKVYVKFEIDKKGQIVNVEILKGFDKSLEKEIIRVLEEAPAWEPAQLGADKVQTQLKIPFSFNIE